MKKKYIYSRFYDFCVNDEYENPGRGVTKRKERVAAGIFAYILFAVYLILFIMNVYRNIYLLGIIFIIFIGLTYETKTGIISYCNYYIIKKIRYKLSPNILEKFCIYHNRDGNYIKIQEKQLYSIKYHPFNWTIIKIFFRDEYKNKYMFKINLKGIQIKVFLSKSYKDKCVDIVEKKTKIQCKYDLGDLNNIKTTKEFMIFIRDKYREIRESISF